MTDQDPTQQNCLTVSAKDGVARLVIDQPRRKNAIDFATWERIAKLVPALAEDADIRVIVLSGRGANFSAGADISEFDTLRGNADSARQYEAANSAAFAAIRDAKVPVIAAIRGICFGGGFGLAAAADLRVATADAMFAVPAARLGLAYPQDAMVDIVSSAGPQMARYLTYTAGVMDAKVALKAGFLLEVVAASRFETRIAEIAQAIAASAPLSVQASKLAITAAVSPTPQAAEIARQAGDLTFESKDYAEGRAAFKEKRPPRFRGL